MTDLDPDQPNPRPSSLALVQRDYGPPRDVLRLVRQPRPEPGPGEVRVRMEAAAVHVADLRTVEGDADFRRPLPRTPGFEGVGRVDALGAGVGGIEVGSRVFPPIGAGTFREFLCVAASGLVPAPEQGDARQLSLLMLNPPTALLLLEDFVPLAAGDWVLQNAANSSVGRYLVRLAHGRGLRSVNVVRRDSVRRELEALGADCVLLDGADLPDRVAAATAGAPLRLAVDAVGGAATARLAACLAEGGQVVNYGSMTREPCHMPFALMFRRDLRLCGFSTVRQLERRSPAGRQALLAGLAARVADGSLAAKIAAVYPLESVVTALEHARDTGERRDGKIVIEMLG